MEKGIIIIYGFYIKKVIVNKRCPNFGVQKIFETIKVFMRNGFDITVCFFFFYSGVIYKIKATIFRKSFNIFNFLLYKGRIFNKDRDTVPASYSRKSVRYVFNIHLFKGPYNRC